MNDVLPHILADVADYYSQRIEEHGTNSKGVDWNRAEEQNLRFELLMQITKDFKEYSINDLGCGYGALYESIDSDTRLKKYIGIDISKSMINEAQQKFGINDARSSFITGDKPKEKADFTIASGLFNVKLNHSEKDWKSYVFQVLDIMNEFSQFGFAFNALTHYSDEDRKEERLHYANPCELFDICKMRYSRNIALLHDYNLYEFTILVRK